MRKAHLIASTIVKLMYRMSELIIIMGRYLGIYAKDSLDELLLITHQSSSYGGKSREVERKAFSEWMDYIDETSETKVAKILGHMNDNGEWIVEPTVEEGDRMDKDYYDYNEDELEGNPLGDNFPYIKGHSHSY